MQPTEIVARLAPLSPLDLAATGVLLQLFAGTLDAAAVLEVQPLLAGYVRDLEKQARAGQEIVERCLQLPPRPTHLPPGF